MDRTAREARLERLAQCPEGHDVRHYYGWLDEIAALEADLAACREELARYKAAMETVVEYYKGHVQHMTQNPLLNGDYAIREAIRRLEEC